VLARLDEWLLGSDDTRWVVVSGGSGMGTSAILSKWLDRREAAGAAVPHHFVRRQMIDWDSPSGSPPRSRRRSRRCSPAQRDARAKPEGRLPELLGRVSKHLGAWGRLVIVVDGLDRADDPPALLAAVDPQIAVPEIELVQVHLTPSRCLRAVATSISSCAATPTNSAGFPPRDQVLAVASRLACEG
jgi:hypothetical protein